jgi:hypothetical protein
MEVSLGMAWLGRGASGLVVYPWELGMTGVVVSPRESRRLKRPKELEPKVLRMVSALEH